MVQLGPFFRIRLTGHVQFSALGYEIMAAWIFQNLDWDGDVGLPNNGNGW